MAKKAEETRIYLVVSKEDYDFDQFLSLLKSKWNFHKERMIQELFHRDETELSAILNLALHLPMFAPKKLIIIKYSNEILSSDIPLLLKYLSHPSPQTILVISGKEISLKSDRRQEFLKCFKRAHFPNVPTTGGTSFWIKFLSKRKREEGIASWIQQQFAEKRLEIEDDAILFFYEICGKDRRTMIHEIEKLACFQKDPCRITMKDIKNMASKNKIFDIYHLFDDICQQERARAIGTLRSLLESDKRHPFIIWHLDNFFSKLAIARQSLDAGDDNQTAARKAGMPYYQDRFIHNARSICYEVLWNAPNLILRADQLIKSGYPEDIILEKLIYDLT